MGRPRLCDCGDCKRCKKREYTQRWRDKNAEKVRQFPSESAEYRRARYGRDQAAIRADAERLAAQRERQRIATQKSRERHREAIKARDRERYQILTLDPEWRARQNANTLASRKRHPNAQRVLEVRARPCVDCGIRLPPEVMDLDHVRGDKCFTLATTRVARRDVTPAMLEDEIAKCDVRCPSCHRLRHWLEHCERLGTDSGFPEENLAA